MKHTYGVVNNNGEHIDVSLTEKGAKIYATRNGYSKVSIRYNNSYTVKVISIKGDNGKWYAPTTIEK